ncbi:MAG TPA: DMT family transporter [Kofleriaceae bacterium]|nr:DMT family transporter [Kofleriaceae bacterium]
MLRLVLAILCVSTGAPWARWAAPAPPLAIGAMRTGFASVLLFAVGWRDIGKLWSLPARDKRLVIASGVLLGVHFGSWIASLSFTSTAASVALVATNPMFAAMFGTLLGDRVTRREVMGIAIAAVGCAVLAGGDWQSGGDALIGDVLALIGAASAAAYLVVGRRLRGSVPLFPYLGAVNAIAAVGLGAALVVSGADIAAISGHSVIACAGAAVVASLVGHSLLNAAVRVTPTHLVALAILGEPVAASLTTWAAFGEQPPIHAALGAAIVIAGIAVGFVRKR